MGWCQMARKTKQTVDFFPHYCLHKMTMFIVEEKYGNDGYAFWFKLLEKLCSSEGHYIDCNDIIKWECFVSKSHITLEKAYSIVDKLSELQAIDFELWQNKVIWCQKFVDNIEDVYKNRRRTVPLKPTVKIHHTIHNNNYPKLPVETDISTPNLPVETDISTPRSTQSKVKYSKVNKSIKENNLTFEEYIDEILKPLFPELDLKVQKEKFDIYWSEGNKKLTRPKTAFRNWCEKAEQYRKEHNNGHKPEQTPVRKYKELSELPD